MPWVYEQRSGRLTRKGRLYATGYSGKGGGKNEPAMQAVAQFGPIPEGAYTIGEPRDTPDHGPFVLRVNPVWPHIMFGRSGFLIHGDSVEHPGEASSGCIIVGRPTREAIAASGDPHLLVVP